MTETWTGFTQDDNMRAACSEKAKCEAEFQTEAGSLKFTADPLRLQETFIQKMQIQ